MTVRVSDALQQPTTIHGGGYYARDAQTVLLYVLTHGPLPKDIDAAAALCMDLQEYLKAGSLSDLSEYLRWLIRFLSISRLLGSLALMICLRTSCLRHQVSKPVTQAL